MRDMTAEWIVLIGTLVLVAIIAGKLAYERNKNRKP